MQWTKDARAMFAHKCAECHEGDMFSTSAFSFNKPFDMNPRCLLCDADMEPEPGFYYGAMFMSYIFSIFIFLGIVMLTHWVMDYSLAQSFIILMVVVSIFFVWWFRFARAFWFNLIVDYRPEKKAVAEAKL